MTQVGSYQRDSSHLPRILSSNQGDQAGLGVSQERVASEQATDPVGAIRGEARFDSIVDAGAVNEVTVSSSEC